MRNTQWFIYIILKTVIVTVFLAGCTSGDGDGGSGLQETVNPTKSSSVVPLNSPDDEAGLRKCGAPPSPMICCEAMIPACNECKEKSRRAMEEWRQRCAPKPAAKPVSDTDDKQGPIDCRVKPSFEQCCQSAEPSCEACRKRIQSLIAVYSEHCR